VDSSLLADTHAIVWYLSDREQLSAPAREALDAADLSGTIDISSITLIELQYLTEKGRLPEHDLFQLDALLESGTSALALAPVDRGVVVAMRQIPRDTVPDMPDRIIAATRWRGRRIRRTTPVPDMPDRIIAATALSLGLPLVTRDMRIRQAPVPIIW
jgi:PIN domain nuclease of toxin-antitoxin system